MLLRWRSSSATYIFLINGEIWQYFDQVLLPTNALDLMYAILKWQVKLYSADDPFFKKLIHLFPCILIFSTRGLDHAKAAQAVTNFFSFSIAKGTRQKAFP